MRVLLAASLCIAIAASAMAAGRRRPQAAALAFMHGLARAPKRLLERVDPARGLVVVRSLGCERERPLEIATHACGASLGPATGAVLAGLAASVRMLSKFDGPEVTCQSRPRAQCRVPGYSECVPEYEVVFADADDGAAVIALIQRDDWQSSPEERAALDRRIGKLLARQAKGCPPPRPPLPG